MNTRSIALEKKASLTISATPVGVGAASCRLPKSILYAGVYRDPVYFPSLSAVVGKRLFNTARGRRDVRNNEANKTRSPIQCLPIEKLAATVFEFANRRLS